MWTLPSTTYVYRPLKKGIQGYDVWVLQLNLKALGFSGGAVDGYFGPDTETGVKDYQKVHFRHSVDWDGIAGIRTQQSMCLVSATPAQVTYVTPGGLIRGIIEGESGFQLPAVSAIYANKSRDIGSVQENLSGAALLNQATLADSFTAKNACDRTLRKLRAKKNEYAVRVSNENAWKYAVLYHNWESAAQAYVYQNINTWQYTARYYPNLGGSADKGQLISKNSDGSENRRYYMTTAAQWVFKASGGRMTTGFQWADAYIASKVKYVTTYTV